jgi:hypothetical protein
MSAPQVSRRSVARGAAWSVPLVAVGVAAPAFAASPGAGATVTVLGGCRCGTGGGTTKPYRLDVTFTNSSTFTFEITDPTITVSGTAGDGVALQTSPAQSNLVPPSPPDTVLRYTFTRGSNPTSDQVTFTYTSRNTTTNVTTPGTITVDVTWATCTTSCQ